MSSFRTVKEAAQITGKSPSSIRRVIYPIIQRDKHPDRHHIQPSPAEALKLRTRGENFAWRLSNELLRREVPIDAATDKGSAPPSHRAADHDDGPLLTMLRRELDIKNQQITQQSELIGKQMELISGLSERLREGNILMGSLQQRLALPDGKGRSPSESVELKPEPKASPEKGSKTLPKSETKRGFFRRLFR